MCTHKKKAYTYYIILFISWLGKTSKWKKCKEDNIGTTGKHHFNIFLQRKLWKIQLKPKHIGSVQDEAFAIVLSDPFAACLTLPLKT